MKFNSAIDKNIYYTHDDAITDAIMWSPEKNKRWYITDIILNVDAASIVTIEDDLTAGDSVVIKANLPANGGFSHHFEVPLKSQENGADLLITTSAGGVFVTLCGYEE